MSSRNDKLRMVLIEMETELKALGLWRDEPPSQEALASTEPFCVDTLSLGEWLQWLLIPRMRELLNADLPLPSNCSIHAIAEESFKGMEQDCSKLLALIETFDQTLSLPH